MNIFNIDRINTFLILVSFLVSCFLPFELFVIVYAILGPLHYLTEINWIKDKKYFLKDKNWLFLCLLLSVIVSIPLLLNLSFIKDIIGDSISSLVLDNSIYTNAAIFLCFVSVIILRQSISERVKIVWIVLAFLVGIVLTNLNSFNLLFGTFIPTIIHVYFFTLLFMWYGSIKDSSKIGYINIVLLALIPVFIFLIPDINWLLPSKNIQDVYVENKFYILNVTISKIIGLSDGTVFNFSDTITTKIQLFISFAYTYHYLNWFSKTSVIGWHKNLTSYKTITIIVVWLLSVGLYAYNYRLGLVVLLFLSYLHVFLEFPINIISIKGIYSFYKKKL